MKSITTPYYSMKNLKRNFLILGLFGLLTGIANISAQIVPNSSGYNQNIEWENVFNDGPPGKVNRAIVDSEGNCVVIFMPDDQSRIHKVDGNTGERIWTATIDTVAGFGITEINDNRRCDYIVSGGSGETQERWVARMNGDDGSVMWSRTYYSEGESWQYDAIRMTIVGSDGYIYGAGLIGGDEERTIFMAYAGEAAIMKIDPANGDEIWTHSNPKTAYALAVVEASDGNLYYGSKVWDEDLTLTKLNMSGAELWTKSLPGTDMIIPSDMDIDAGDTLYFGGHAGRDGAGYPFDYSCVKMDTTGNIEWVKHYANPRGYSMSYIRNELYGTKVGPHGIYLFGGTGDESEYYSVENPPFMSSDVWNGWVVIIDRNGDILRSDVYCHEEVNTATEYGCVTDDGYVIFNDTDAFGDTEVGIMKIAFDGVPGSGDRYTLTTSSAANGSVSPEGTISCLENTYAPINGVAEEGYEFDYLSGDISGSENPKAISMDSDKDVTAHFKLATSINPYSANDDIIIYPNPAKSENIVIQTSDVEGFVNIEITDMNGRLIISRKQQVNTDSLIQLPIHKLKKGIYNVSMSSDDFRINKKLIIE